MPSNKKLRITGIEAILSSHDEALKAIDGDFMRIIEENRPDFLVLPEKWIMEKYMEGSSGLSKILEFFQNMSKEFDMTIIPGSFSIFRNGSLYNTSPVIANGKVLGWSDKISLYRIEKNEYSPGRDICVFESRGIKFSVAVCYDLDFPYYTKIAIRKGARILFNPSLIIKQFHEMWHLYVKGRSLENRIPIISVNSSSEPLGGNSLGTSLVELDRGVILESHMAEQSVLSYEIDMSRIDNMIENRMNEDPGKYSFLQE